MKYAVAVLVGLFGCGGANPSSLENGSAFEVVDNPDAGAPVVVDDDTSGITQGEPDAGSSNPDCVANPNAPGCPDPTCTDYNSCGNAYCWPHCETGNYVPGTPNGTNVQPSGGAQRYQ